MRACGRFVADRFGDLPNIVWVMGGDFTPEPGDRWAVAELAGAIRRIDSVHLMTEHGSSTSSAVSTFGE